MWLEPPFNWIVYFLIFKLSGLLGELLDGLKHLFRDPTFELLELDELLLYRLGLQNYQIDQRQLVLSCICQKIIYLLLLNYLLLVSWTRGPVSANFAEFIVTNVVIFYLICANHRATFAQFFNKPEYVSGFAIDATLQLYLIVFPFVLFLDSRVNSEVHKYDLLFAASHLLLRAVSSFMLASKYNEISKKRASLLPIEYGQTAVMLGFTEGLDEKIKSEKKLRSYLRKGFRCRRCERCAHRS